MSKRKMVIVTWEDAWGHEGWEAKTYTEEHAHGVQVLSCGWLVSDDEKGVMLATSIADDDGRNGHFFIPRGMVKAVKAIRVPTTLAPEVK